MIHDPVDQGVLKTDIVASLFGLEPLVTKDFFALRLKFSIQREIFDCLVVARLRLVRYGHRAFTTDNVETEER